jgi:hypothetical protein
VGDTICNSCYRHGYVWDSELADYYRFIVGNDSLLDSSGDEEAELPRHWLAEDKSTITHLVAGEI